MRFGPAETACPMLTAVGGYTQDCWCMVPAAARHVAGQAPQHLWVPVQLLTLLNSIIPLVCRVLPQMTFCLVQQM
jgi:hypothetical protein